MTSRFVTTATVALLAQHAALSSYVGGGDTPPVGGLENLAADGTSISGWALDSDFPGPVAVHVYVDNQLVQHLVANGNNNAKHPGRGFEWNPPTYGPGKHTITAYAIGVDAQGQPDGDNIAVTGTPTKFTGNCNRLSGSAAAWCNGVPSCTLVGHCKCY